MTLEALRKDMVAAMKTKSAKMLSLLLYPQSKKLPSTRDAVTMYRKHLLTV